MDNCKNQFIKHSIQKENNHGLFEIIMEMYDYVGKIYVQSFLYC